MDLTDIAEWIAVHSALALFTLVLIMMLLTAVLWQLIDSFGATWLNRAATWWLAGSRHALARRVRAVPVVGPTLRLTVRHTVSVGRYLGTHAIVSFIVALAAVMTLVAIADEIGIDESLAQFDIALSSALSRHLSDAMLQGSAVITHLGDRFVLIALASAVAVVLFWRREFLFGWAWLAATAGGGIMNSLLKVWFARVRPVRAHDFASVDGWSFPSGHACGSMLVYGLLGYLVLRHARPAMHLAIAASTVVLVVGIGASRVLLQVHYLSDVLAGWATATIWMSLCIAGLEAVRRRMGNAPRVADPLT